ncbi:hypothetical protein L1277_000255 [Okibacterium sp. HSC-33S16]|uniref:hypothetical protein n=1 Tax=Okibacterium sp. HSC-33S16 TaxID=2910965 RepID=UPI00209CF4C9|nr:hypothetical protein [Okibacterium sp. HSC-33S16]MCP2030191.1 hypothetical protein [Okibacterium sp. HSC-33S16]
MKTTLATTSVRHDHPPQTTLPETPYATRRVGPLDRAALHLGVALIKWGRRPVKADGRSTRYLSEQAEEARRHRDALRDEFLALQFFR